MKSGAPWSIKGIEPESREAAKEKAREAGMTLGQWLNQTIAEAGQQKPGDSASPAPAGGSALDTARIMRAIAEVARRVDVAATSTEGGSAADTSRFDRLEARLDELSAALPQSTQALDQSRLERGLVAIARRIDQVEKSANPEALLTSMREEIRNAPQPSVDTAELNASVSGLSAQIDTISNRISDIETGLAAKEHEPEARATDNSAELERISQDVRKLMNGLVNLAGKVDAVSERVDASTEPLSQEIADLRTSSERRSAEDREAIGAQLASVSSDRSAPGPHVDIEAAVAAAVAPLAASLGDLRQRLDQRTAEPESPAAPPESMGAVEERPEPAPAEIAETVHDTDPVDEIADEPLPTEQARSRDEQLEDEGLQGIASLHDLTRADDIQVRPFDDDEDGFFRDIDEDSSVAESSAELPVSDTGPDPAQAPSDEDPLHTSEDPADFRVSSAPLDHIPDDANPPDRPRRLVPVESLLAQPTPGAAPVNRPSAQAASRSEPSLAYTDTAPKEAAPGAASDAGATRQPFRLDEPLDLSRQAPAAGPAEYPGKRRWAGYLLVALFFLALFVAGFWFMGTAQFKDLSAEASKIWDQAVTAVKGADLGNGNGDEGDQGRTETNDPPVEAAAVPAPAASSQDADGEGGSAGSEDSNTETADVDRQAALQPATEPDSATPAAESASVQQTAPAPSQEPSELERLETRAAEGDADAQYALGVRYRDGIGVSPNYATAADWFDRAAQQGQIPAQLGLGIMYRQGLGRAKDLDLAKLWLHAAARAGDADAQKLLGEVYVDESAGVPDYFQAARWFRAAAEQGVVDAQYNMGVLYEGGLGVPRDFAQAYYWFSLAANAGDASAPEDRERNAQLLTPEQRAQLDQQVAAFSAGSASAPASRADATPSGEDLVLQRRDEIRVLQQLLIARGYDPGSPDGIPGSKTRQAIEAWQNDQGITATGQVTRNVLESLKAGG